MARADDNSTLSTLPTGLQRYTGEQDFDLLVVNNTQGSPLTVQNVPEPYGTAVYNAALQPGLNNILVPRGEFLSSPLGQSLLNNSGLNPATQHTPLGFTASEWLDRIQNLSSTDPNYIALYSSQSGFSCTGGANCGTDPQNPTVEQGHTALQVQAVFTLNISSSGDFANLMGGLLQNYSGNLTGSLQDVTNELPTLGLTAPVLSALANATLVNDGAFSQPVSNIQSSSPSWLSAIASVVWNTVSGVAHAISVAWNYAVAAASYLYHAAVSLAQHLASTIQAAVDHAISALKAIASAMEAALQALLAFIEKEVTSFLQDALATVTSAIKELASQYASPVLDGLLTGSGAGTATFGPPLQILFVLGATITTALFVATGIFSAITFGVGDIILFVAPLLISLAFQALGSNSPFSPDVSSLGGLAFGQAMWQGDVSSVGPTINAIAALQGEPLDSNAQGDLSNSIANIRDSADITGGLIALAAAIGLAATGNGPTGAIGSAALGLGMAIAGFLLFGYLLTTTQSDEQISSLIGEIADLLSASLATLSIVLLGIALSRGLPEPAPLVFGIIMFFEGVVLLADGLLLLPVLESM